MEQFDVVVIGASVSGAPTAMHLARQGHKVLLIDRKQFPRDTLSTHFIWPRGVSYLKRWGIADPILNRTPHFTHMEVVIEGIRMFGSIPLQDIEQRFQKVHGDANGATNIYCGPRRLLLDHELVKAAVSAGADVRERVTFTRPVVDNGAITGIHAVTEQGTQIQANARLVIGADGRFSQFAKSVGAETTDYRSNSTFAYFGYFSGIDKDELTIRNRGRLGTAIFPTSDGTHMVLTYGPSAWWDEFRRDPEGNFFRTYEFCDPETAEMIRRGRREEPFKACGTMPAFQRKNIGGGWALLGDAGSFKDQVTAMGITHAFRDAELISGYVDQGLQGEMSLDQALDAYRAARLDDYERYFNFVCQTAEMRIRTRDELSELQEISEDSAKTDRFLAQFGDTHPLPDALSSPVSDVSLSTSDGDRSAVPGYQIPPYALPHASVMAPV
ncbi:flavoprotein monooxygenase [Burkholderia mayonis]|uniref:Flavoprotein monooxygenase n=1 Tax=Burkholderia mayonis TaxID=1385591 RepID=A0A1B4FPH5_9BURK|nr:NAD(P)/FAD-dependent oxidoreductase [Burkholderia mayonis]AOJ05570.1 flavoprotein monooxygenase [Burkholderia mayonis]KVE42226.1 flavoprotein monooxygenase [Burkholderia mayonis]